MWKMDESSQSQVFVATEVSHLQIGDKWERRANEVKTRGGTAETVNATHQPRGFHR